MYINLQVRQKNDVAVIQLYNVIPHHQIMEIDVENNSSEVNKKIVPSVDDCHEVANDVVLVAKSDDAHNDALITDQNIDEEHTNQLPANIEIVEKHSEIVKEQTDESQANANEEQPKVTKLSGIGFPSILTSSFQTLKNFTKRSTSDSAILSPSLGNQDLYIFITKYNSLVLAF